MADPVFPDPVFPGPVFPDPVFPGVPVVGAVAVGSYRHSAPAPIKKRAARDLYSLAKEFEAMED